MCPQNDWQNYWTKLTLYLRLLFDRKEQDRKEEKGKVMRQTVYINLLNSWIGLRPPFYMKSINGENVWQNITFLVE